MDTLDKHCSNEALVLQFHHTDIIVEDLHILGRLCVLSASAFEHYNLHNDI